VKTLNITDKTGDLISIKNVSDDNDLMIINRSGIIIRLSVAELRVMGRATQGVRLINLRNGDEIAAVAKVDALDEEDLVDIDGIEVADGAEGTPVLPEEGNAPDSDETSDTSESEEETDD